MSDGFCLPPDARIQLRASKGASLSSSQQPTLENCGLVPEWARVYQLVLASTLPGELSFLFGLFWSPVSELRATALVPGFL